MRPLLSAAGTWVLLLMVQPALADPTTAFIVAADSVYQTKSESALAELVHERAPIVGAAVAQLLDVGLTLGDEGNEDAETENLEFARRLAELHARDDGPTGPLDLVRTARAWDSVQREQRRQAKELEEQARQARDGGELGRAARLVEDAQEIYREIGDSWSLAVTWGTLGVIHWYAGDFDAVETAYRKALEARRSVDDRILLGRTQNGLGSVHLNRNQFAEARQWYDLAAQTRRSTGDVEGLGTSLTYLGHCYANEGRTIEARRVYEKQALPILEEHGTLRSRAELHDGIANLYALTGRNQDALRHYREAQELAARSEDMRTRVRVEMNAASLLRKVYRLREAEEGLRRTEELLAAFTEEEEAFVLEQETYLALERGSLQQSVGDFDRARDEYLEALRKADALGDPWLRADARLSLSLVLTELGAPDRAYRYVDEGKSICQESGYVAGLYQNHIREIDAANRLGQTDRALAASEQALELARRTENPQWEIQAQIARANTLTLLERSEEARRIYRESRTRMEEGGFDGLRMSVLCGIGDTFEESDPDSAVHYYRLAVEEIEKQRQRSAVVGSLASFYDTERGFLLEEILRYYARMQANSPDGPWCGRAFEIAERRKARSLLDEMATEVRLEGSEEYGGLLDVLYAIDASTAEGRDRRNEVETEIARLRTEARRTGGDDRDVPTLVGLEELQSWLAEDEALLQYSLGDSASFAWSITRASARLVALPDKRELGRQVRALRDALARPESGGGAIRRLGAQLHETLIAPFGLENTGAHTLIFVPDGALFELPFEVLVASPVDAESPWSAVDFLCTRYTTAYAVSSSVLVDARRSPKSVGERNQRFRVAAFGNPEFKTLSPRPGTHDEPLAPLPHAAAEIASIAHRVGPEASAVFVGEEATEKRWKEVTRTSSLDVMHLATHGLVDAREPDLSCVVLARDRTGTEDGYLHTLEVLGSSLDVDLVVLSACESGRGRLHRGEGVVGLGRAFLGAGARRLVVSLWKVSDASTARLMDVFYEGLLDRGLSPERALADARRGLLADEDSSHPFHWAPFVLIGTPSSSQSPRQERPGSRDSH